MINKIEGVDWRTWYTRLNLNRHRKSHREKIGFFKGRKRIPIEELENLPIEHDNVLLFVSQVEAPKGHTKEWLELSKKIDTPILPFFIIREYSRFTKENFSKCKININYCDRDSRSSDDFGYYLRSLEKLPEYCNIISAAVEKINLTLPSLNGIVKEVSLYLDTRPNGQVDVSVENLLYYNCMQKDYFSYDRSNYPVARVTKGKNEYYVSCNPYGSFNPYFPEENEMDAGGVKVFGVSVEELDNWNIELNKIMRSLEDQIKVVINNMDQNIKDTITQEWKEYYKKEQQKLAGGRTASEWEAEFSMWDK